MVNTLIFDYKQTSGVPIDQLERLQDTVEPLVAYLRAHAESLEATDYAFIALPENTAMYDRVQVVAHQVKKLSPTVLVIIGIGGSNLGIRAVQEALLGTLYNQTNTSLKIYYADTLDTTYIQTIMGVVARELEQGNNVIFNVISKSGSTLETLGNLEVFVELVRSYKQDTWHKYLVVTTDYNSVLWHFALTQGICLLEIPKNVGGRYSIFSPVGLFPLLLLGIDVPQLRQGAADMTALCLQHNNAALISACILQYHYRHGKNIHDTFLFSVEWESIGKWYRQLMAESIGKELNRHGIQVNVGITPTVSIGTNDLHSVAQLYLGGAFDKYTTFIAPKRESLVDTVKVPCNPMTHALSGDIQDRTYGLIMDAILQGVKKSYTHADRPFSSIALSAQSAYGVGQLLQFKMFEIIYLSELLEVNPFDQPNVESYKKATHTFLQKIDQ